MSLKTIRDRFHSLLLHIRSTNRVIQSSDFAIAYDNATEEERARLESALDINDRDAIKNFIKAQLATMTPFHEMKVKQLREIGRNVRLPEYWLLGKQELIREIENVNKKS